MDKHVKTAMTKEPVSIAPDVALMDALEIMRSWGMRHLPVTESDGSVVGLLSERDILRKMASHSGSKSTVKEAMSADPYLVDTNTLLADVAETMAKEKIGCAVVMGRNGLAGIFTTTDALRILARLLREDDGDPYKVMRIEDYFQTRVCA